MKYAEVNWIVIIIFAIGIISQIVEALRRNKGGSEELPIPEPVNRSPSPAAPRNQQEGEIEDLLESLGLPRSTREERERTPRYEEEVATKTNSSLPLETVPEMDEEGPRKEFPKQISQERYESPFPTYSEVLPATSQIQRFNFDEELEEGLSQELNVSASRFQVINARQGVGDIRKQLRTPAALRQAFILKEILDPPKGLSAVSF